ncbi:MAG TPA: alcohol dehydrogenase catalytic domain-containing protein [Ilumatobacteraceae bacterium]|nr:alcohol dehydrogenase catalytic domain-containing protein [Ilumatobacteraceae bacterium]
MKAALRTAAGNFQIGEVEEPKLGSAGWVRARVKVAGICGTDLRHWKKPEPELEGHIMGHELSGEVIEVGEDVSHVKPGDRVVIETVMGDGECPWCRVQRYNICPHLYQVRTGCVSRAYADEVVGPKDKFYKLPDNVSFEEAALIDTFAVSLHAQHVSGLSINDKVAVIGAGPIGLAQMMLATASGADVFICDLVDSALDMAKNLGADAVMRSDQPDIVDQVMAQTDGRGADIVFECAGGASMPDTLPLATRLARRGGKVVVVGGFDSGEVSIPLDWQRIQMSEIQLLPSASFAFWDIYPEQGAVLDMIAKGRLNVRPLITHTFPIEQINEAFDVAQDKQSTGAVFVALTLSSDEL